MSEVATYIEIEKRSAVRSRRVPKLRFKEFEGEWKGFSLKHLIKDLQSGISVNSEDRPIANNFEFGILKTSAVANGLFTKSENKKIVDEEITRAKLNPTKNEIIISRMNTPQLVGESGYVDETYSNLFVPDRLWQTVTFPEKCHNRWLSYFLITDRVRYNLKSIATGTSGSMKNISKPNFLSIRVNIPTLPEQQKIASFLSAVDEKTEQLTKKKELLEQYKKGVMQQLFRSAGSGQASGQLRFKDENGNDYPDWEEKRLGEICEVNPKIKVLPSNFVYIDLESVEKGQLIKENRIDLIDAPSRAQRSLEVGDILYQTVRPYQKNNLFFNRIGDYVASTGYAQLRYKESAMYIYQLMHHDGFVNKVLVRCTGTSYPAINSTDLAKIHVSIPCLEEQQKIATYLSSIDTKIESVNNQITQTQSYKKGLLQQMFV